MGKLSEFKSQENLKSQDGKKENLTEKDVMDKYNMYKDMSSDQLNSELFKEVAKQKQAGTFDYNKLENMLESLKGSLSNENYQNMKRILESLK